MSRKKDEEKVISLEKEKDKKTIYRVCKNRDNPYVMLNKGFFEDPFISLKSKGLLGYLLSKPDNWIIYREEILKHCTDGKDSLQTAINELKRTGYLKVVPERNEKGEVIKWVTLVFETPHSMLHVVEKNPEAENPNLVKNETRPESGNPDSGFSRSGKPATTNNDLVLNNKNTNNNLPKPEPQNQSPEPEPNVVASLIEKAKELAVAETLLRTWLKKHSAEYILEKIEYTKAHATKNPAGLLRRAIENNYQQHLANESKAEQKPPVEVVYPSHEENLAWYAGLSDEEKLSLQKEAVHKQYTFERMLEAHNFSVLDADFVRHGLFKMMMEIIGRAK